MQIHQHVSNVRLKRRHTFGKVHLTNKSFAVFGEVVDNGGGTGDRLGRLGTFLVIDDSFGRFRRGFEREGGKGGSGL